MSDTTVEAKISFVDEKGTEQNISYSEFKDFVTNVLDQNITIDEITVSLSVKRQAVKFEATNDYFQSTKLVGAGPTIRLLKDMVEGENTKHMNKVISEYLIKKTASMMDFCRHTIRNECTNDGIPVKFLGDQISGRSK